MKVSKYNINFKTTKYSTIQKNLAEIDKDLVQGYNEFIKTPTSNVREPLKRHWYDLRDIVRKIQENAQKDISDREKKSRYIESLGRIIKKVTDNKKFTKLALDDSLPYILAIGNACKEGVGTAMYTVQALTNEDLPEDKRKFVGMYDLAVGAISTTLSLVFGLTMVYHQKPLIRKLIGAKPLAKINGKLVETEETKLNKVESSAYEGMKFLIPVILQTILVKRIIAPAVATPVAGDLRKKLEAKEAAKNGIQKPLDLSIPDNNNIVLSSSGIKTNVSSQDTKINQPQVDIFAVYKKATETK